MKHALMSLAVLLLVPVAGRAACTDLEAVVSARRAADQACEQAGKGCSTAKSHGQYVACVTKHARADATLPKECRGKVIRCAARSSCGKAGFRTCCVTSHDATKCRVRTACTAPNGGTACAGEFASCCDACSASGCATTTISTTTISTTTTSTTVSGPPCSTFATPCGSCGVGWCTNVCSAPGTLECLGQGTGDSCRTDADCPVGTRCAAIVPPGDCLNRRAFCAYPCP